MTENPYQSPAAVAPEPEELSPEKDLAKSRNLARAAVRDGLIVQGIVLLLAALSLDGGHLFRTCVIATIAYWIAAMVILIRRWKKLSSLDHLFLRFGVLLIAFVVPLLARLVYFFIGESHLSGIERWF